MATADDNRTVEILLFELATWHALAKLRLHTETTLTALESSGMRLGKALRRFQDTVCSQNPTYELPSEAEARYRRQEKAHLKKTKASNPPASPAPAPTSKPREKSFNMKTYKLHSLGDYPASIRQFGTTDNTTTQTVS